jgi:hypothetical protein
MLQGYLEFSGYIVEYILDYLNRRAWMLGVQEALFSLLTIRGLRDVYLACRNTPYKKFELEDVFRGVNKVYGNLLVLTGGAIYRPMTPREIPGALQRVDEGGLSCALHANIQTRRSV